MSLTYQSIDKRLQSFIPGDAATTEALLQEVLPALSEIARRELNGQQNALGDISESELILNAGRVLSKGAWRIRERGHFYALASMVMRRVLVERARKLASLSKKRNERSSQESHSSILPPARDGEQVVQLGVLMDELEAADSDAARVVDMHYFGGFSLQEIADATGLTLREVRSRWSRGVSWLKRGLTSGGISGHNSDPGNGAAPDIIEEVEDCFENPTLWLHTENSNLGGRTPQHLIDSGREDEIREFLRTIRFIGIT